jgi:hypothetical protein
MQIGGKDIFLSPATIAGSFFTAFVEFYLRWWGSYYF